MFLEAATATIAIILGLFAGIIAGLAPGLHTNNVAILLIAITSAFNINVFAASLFILSAAVAQSFAGFIPSIFLGAPDEGTALSTAPGHQLLLQGRGYEALILSIYGGIIGAICIVIFLPIILQFLPTIYKATRPIIVYILIAVAIYMILIEGRKFMALIVFLMSGFLGIIALNSNVNSGISIFCMLSGLFGLSSIFLSLLSSQKIPEQKNKSDAGKRSYILQK